MAWAAQPAWLPADARTEYPALVVPLGAHRHDNPAATAAFVCISRLCAHQPRAGAVLSREKGFSFLASGAAAKRGWAGRSSYDVARALQAPFIVPCGAPAVNDFLVCAPFSSGSLRHAEGQRVCAVRIQLTRPACRVVAVLNALQPRCVRVFTSRKRSSDRVARTCLVVTLTTTCLGGEFVVSCGALRLFRRRPLARDWQPAAAARGRHTTIVTCQRAQRRQYWRTSVPGSRSKKKKVRCN